jgi:hypothetical protein
MPANINKYGRKGVPANWDAIKAMWVAGETAGHIAKIFNVCEGTIGNRAKRGKWRLLRNVAAAHRTLSEAGHLSSEKTENEPTRHQSVTFSDKINLPTNEKRSPNELATNEEIVAKAVAIGNASEFRQRVIKENERALKVLEGTEIGNVAEVDRFAEALIKVERIGARSYGYDREANTPAVNIAVLTAGGEYD